MELKEFNKLCEDIREKTLDEYEKAKELFNSESPDIKSLNENNFIIKNYKNIEIDYGISLEDMIEELQEAKKEIYKLSNGLVGFETSGNVEIEAYADYDCAFIDFFGIKYSYFDLASLESVEMSIKKKIRFEVERMLNQTSRFARPVDCKLLELYKSGTIDWKALQKLVYSDCEL